MLPFIRSDLAQFTSYQPHPNNPSGLQSTPTEVDRLDANESPYDLPTKLKEKLAWTQQLIKANRYPDGGHQALKNAIAAYINESASFESPLFSAANITVGNGSDELIRSLLIATCLGGEGSILVATPTFVMYGIVGQTLGLPVVTISRNESNFQIDLEAAQTAIEQTQDPPIRAIFVVHPNSPTGNILTAEEVKWLKNLPDNILVVIDEAYFEFSQTTLLTELKNHSNWIILRTFSKAFRLAAYRVGYGVAHPGLVSILEKVRLPYNLSSFSISAALVALENRQLLLESVAQIKSERSQIIKTLSQYSTINVWDSAANFVFLRLKSNINHKNDSFITDISRKLRANGTIVREISSGLRITVGNPEENLRMLNRIQAALENL